jgi:organic radical activating enzyme
MLSIFVEASCNRYVRDECRFCHVYAPLKPVLKDSREYWHMTPDTAELMAEKIKTIAPLKDLAKKEINLTGGEASQNPHIVEVYKIFRTLSTNVRLHTNLDINSEKSRRWERLVDITRLRGRIDITLYPTVWESRQKPLLEKIIKLQNGLIVNLIYESLEDLLRQVSILVDFFNGQNEKKYIPILELLNRFCDRLKKIIEVSPQCREDDFLNGMGDLENYVSCPGGFVFAVNAIPSFYVNPEGVRDMSSLPFPKDIYKVECTAVRGVIEIMTILQTGEMTPCCDVGNLKCKPKFGNVLADSPEAILKKFDESQKLMASGVLKNIENMKTAKVGEWVEEGIPPFCI